MLSKFLAVDPGENTGWSVWNGDELLDAGQTPMWDFSDAVWSAALAELGVIVSHCPVDFENLPVECQDVAKSLFGIERIVCEEWQIYPWEAHPGNLDWDECRTARLIGSLTAAARFAGWNWETQPAKIKERAEAAGAEAFFFHPLHENRHMNDSIRHGVFRNAVERGAAWTDLSKSSWEAE